MRFERITYNPKVGQTEIGYQVAVTGGHDDRTLVTQQDPVLARADDVDDLLPEF